MNSALQAVFTLALAVAVAILLGYFAPGATVDARELDATLGEETRQAIRAERARMLFQPVSLQFGVPVGQLLAERWPATARACLYGWTGAWVAVAAFLLVALFFPGFDKVIPAAGLSMLCIPAGVVAVACYLLQWPVAVAIGAAVFPRVLLFARNLLAAAHRSPHVVTARAKGCSRGRVFVQHQLRPRLAEIAALAAVSVTIALGAAIPAEVFSDLPGLGQLAWKAATARDLPVLIALTLALSTLTVTLNMFAAFCQRSFRV